MSKLESIAIKGFRSFGKEVEVPLRPLNVLIGANGAGKSNFLETFSLLRAFAEDRLQAYVRRGGGADRFLHFGSRTTQRLSIRTAFDDSDAYFFELSYGRGDLLYPGEHGSGNPETEDYWFVGKPRLPEMGEKVRNSRSRLASSRTYHFQDTSIHSAMKKTRPLNDNRFLRSDASNLAAFLYFLREKHAASYGLIRHTVQLAAPFFEDFDLKPLALKPNTILLEWRHKRSDAYFDADDLSDGTLRFMALATLLLQPKELRPSIVLIDEPELGLHPYAIAMLAAMARSASRKTQVVLATQSPILLDHFEPEDVLVADRVDGETRIERLAAEELNAWLEDYSLGQLWEKNHFGGRPAREKPAQK